jgi:hypothetical protein
MAEGWLRHLAGDRYDVCSAGMQPACLNPGSVEGWPRSGSTSHITDSSTPRSMRRSPSTMLSRCAIAPKRVALVGPEPFDSSIEVSIIRQPPQSPPNNADKYSGESAKRSLHRFASSRPQFRHDPPCQRYSSHKRATDSVRSHRDCSPSNGKDPPRELC